MHKLKKNQGTNLTPDFLYAMKEERIRRCCDTYGAQFTEDRIRGCQWHFKSDVRNYVNRVGPKRREDFKRYCDELCECTTVAHCDELFGELKHLAEKYPEIKGFVKYWELRKSHVFGPYRGCGLPGVNLSEPANHTFKPLQTLSLVEAAKYNVATMMRQETQIDLFERNMLKCSGHGPSKEVKDSRERAQQMKVAADFVNIFDDHSAVMLEAEQGMNPAKYIQKKGTHRAPPPNNKAKETTCKARGNKVTSKTTAPQRVIDEQQLQAKCIVIMEIMDCDLLPESAISLVKNPPFIIKAEWNIQKCKSCKKDITKEDKEYPHNMVFRRIGLHGYMNKTLNKWI